MKKILIIIIFNLFIYSSFSQNIWTLQDCIDYALENNLQIKIQKLSVEYNQNILQQSKAEILPNLNFGASQAYSFGWSNDPFTNEFSRNNTQTLNLSLTSSVTLFNGFKNYNTIQKNSYNLKSSLATIEKIKNDVSLNVAATYLQILFNQELLEIAENQYKISDEQFKKTNILVIAGNLPEGSLLESEAQLALEQVEIVNTQNQLNTSYLTLIQLLELDSIQSFEILPPQNLTEIDTNLLLPEIQQIYNEALKLPQIEAVEYELMSSEENLEIAKSGLYPTLTLSASYGTGYSDVRKHYSQEFAGFQPYGFVGATGDSVYIPVINTIENDYLFFDQLNDNQSKYLAINLQIPIFNRYYTKTNISNSKIEIENSKYQLQIAKNELYKDIQQAYNDVYAALAKYKASKKAEEAMQKSFDYTEKKFNAGLLTTLEFNTSKNSLTKAQSDLLQAKYEYIFKINILNFYRGIPLNI